ncbi:protein YIPF3-like [Styela clava]
MAKPGGSEEDWGGFSSGDELTPKSSTQSAAVIDMGAIDSASSLTSSFEDISDTAQARHRDTETSDPTGVMGGLGGGIGKVVADQFLQSGRQQARRIFDLYGNIDILRPYFDVEPKILANRLLYSFVPVRSLATPQKIPSELYGPLMTVFTMVAILLMTMKASGTVLQQGTLMGTAFGICFGYWVGVSGFMYFLAYLCNTYISLVQCLSLLGYGMVSHCIILLCGHITHYTHTMFYLLWLTLAGAAASRMITIMLSRTVGNSQRILLCASIACLHMLFLLYLHFAYHTVVEIIFDAIDMKHLHQIANTVAIDTGRLKDGAEALGNESLTA